MRDRPLFPLILLSAALVMCPPDVAGQERHYAKARSVDAEHLKLVLDVDLERRRLQGVAILDAVVQEPVSSLSLDAIGHQVEALTLTVDGELQKGLRWVNTGERLELELGRPLPRGAKLRIESRYVVERPASGLHFYGPSAEDPDVPLQVWSQGETLENRHWFPSFDHPGERQSSELVVTVPRGYQVLSNGRLMERTEGEATATYHWKQERSHPSYLVTLVVGRFDVLVERWRDKPVEHWVPLGWKSEAMNSFVNTRRMLDFFSERTGVDYPWEKYVQVVVEQFNFGGMENTSATTLNESTLHDTRAHLDFSSDGLVAHELAHQWYGDLLTCRDWAHIWLNEGFATYFEALWAEHDKGPEEFAYNMFNKQGGALGSGRDKPILDRGYSHPDAMFDGRAYPKGAWTLHMLRRRLGEAAFWRGIRLYTKKNQGRSVETVELRQALEAATGRSLERFFYDAVERAGHPVFKVRFRWLAEDRLVEAVVSQSQKGAAYHVPVTVLAVGQDGGRVERRVLLTEKRQTIYLPLSRRPAQLRFDPDNSVLKELEVDKARDWWLAQLEQDPDVVGRILAARALAKLRRPEVEARLIARLASDPFWGVRVELARALAKAGGVRVRDALIVGLRGDADPKARRACAEGLGAYRGDAAAGAALRGLITDGDASYYVEAAATEAIAKVLGAEARDLLRAQLAKPSHRDTIRDKALRGLAGLEEPSLLPLFLVHSRGPHSPATRRAAIAALGRLGALEKLDDEAVARVVERLSSLLEGDSLRMRREALSALRVMGKRASSTRAMLELLVAHDPQQRVRESARQALDSLRKDAPKSAELERLRAQLRALQKSSDAQALELSKLAARLEVKGGKGRRRGAPKGKKPTPKPKGKKPTPKGKSKKPAQKGKSKKPTQKGKSKKPRPKGKSKKKSPRKPL